jgi:2-polyprenyl-6-hydroxyphenyl methylase/3-demethylubiquinone-9 3-methyltransferase
MKISDEKRQLLKLYKDSSPAEKLKIYARIIFNFEQIKKHLDSFIPAEGNVLDWGCGYGIFANYLRLKNPKLNVVGFDISKVRIEEANKTTPLVGVKFTSDPSEIKFDRFKLVLLIDVLLFLPVDEKKSLLKTIYTSLERGGIVFIKDTLKSESLSFKWTKFEESLKLKFGVYGKNVKSGLHYIDVGELTGILEGIGYEIVDVTPEMHIIYPGVFVIARK